jgi:hypothetical protein
MISSLVVSQRHAAEGLAHRRKLANQNTTSWSMVPILTLIWLSSFLCFENIVKSIYRLTNGIMGKRDKREEPAPGTKR